MINAVSSVPKATNEPVLPYGPKTKERDELKKTLVSVADEKRELTLIINGKEIATEKKLEVRPPHKRNH